MSNALKLFENSKADARNTLIKARGGELLNDPTELALEASQIVHNATLGLLTAHQSIGQAILAAFWEIWRDQHYFRLGEYNSFEEYILGEFGTHTESQYVGDLALIVTRVFANVYAKQTTKHPFVDKDGQPITVERLLSTPKMMWKLKTMSRLFENPTWATQTDKKVKPEADPNDDGGAEITEDQQAQILDTMLHGTRDQVANLRDELTGKKTPIRIPFVLVPLPNGRVHVEGELNDEQMAVFKALVGEAADYQFSA